MSKSLKPSRTVVQPRASRIRRDPPPPPSKIEAARSYWDPSEWESWVVVTGVTLFGIALAIIIIGFSDYTNG